MKDLIKAFFIIGLLMTFKVADAQYLPPSYEAIFDEIVKNFEEIRGTKSIEDGKTSLRLLSDEKIIIRMDHKRSVKTLTFVKTPDEEGSKYWICANQLTTDMINKYEKDMTKIVEKMVEISREESKQ